MYGILECTSKSRVNGTGLPFRPFNPATPPNGSVHIVHSKRHKETHVDQWAKINPETDELMEIIGPVGEQETETLVLRHLFTIGCKYPTYPVSEPPKMKCPTPYQAITVDGPTTLDRDDALSIDETPDGIQVGIHITDLTSQLSSDWLEWARSRGSSAYWEGGSKPMLPPALAHGSLSLNVGGTYSCISLLLEYDSSYTLLSSRMETDAEVMIRENTTYDRFQTHVWGNHFRKLSKKEDATDWIAWAMIRYNLYLAIHYKGILLRVQDQPDTLASYAYEGTHASIQSEPVMYSHGTSPIRRFADFHNQFVIKGIVSRPLRKDNLIALNARMEQVRQFHHRETILNLAYQCKETPMKMDAKVEVREDGRSIKLCSPLLPKPIWIPFSDVYYSEPICDYFRSESDISYPVELIGIHKHGMASLRIRLLS